MLARLLKILLKLCPQRKAHPFQTVALDERDKVEASPEARAAHKQAEQEGLLGEVITLPWRRRGNRGQASGLGVTHNITHNITHSVTHTGDRSKGAERQARYRAKDPDGYRLRHREYMAARRAKAKASKTLAIGATRRGGRFA